MLDERILEFDKLTDLLIEKIKNESSKKPTYSLIDGLINARRYMSELRLSSLFHIDSDQFSFDLTDLLQIEF